jgi:hypothetical protein
MKAYKKRKKKRAHGNPLFHHPRVGGVIVALPRTWPAPAIHAIAVSFWLPHAFLTCPTTLLARDLVALGDAVTTPPTPPLQGGEREPSFARGERRNAIGMNNQPLETQFFNTPG